MVFRPFLFAPGSCASYLFGCTTHGKLAVVDPHVDLVDEYVGAAGAIGSPITAAETPPTEVIRVASVLSPDIARRACRAE